MVKSKTNKGIKKNSHKNTNRKIRSFKPRMYRMKLRISKKNLNNIARNKKNQNNGVSFTTIGSYVENRKQKIENRKQKIENKKFIKQS